VASWLHLRPCVWALASSRSRPPPTRGLVRGSSSRGLAPPSGIDDPPSVPFPSAGRTSVGRGTTSHEVSRPFSAPSQESPLPGTWNGGWSGAGQRHSHQPPGRRPAPMTLHRATASDQPLPDRRRDGCRFVWSPDGTIPRLDDWGRFAARQPPGGPLDGEPPRAIAPISGSSSRVSRPASFRLRRFSRPWRLAPLQALRCVSTGHTPGVWVPGEEPAGEPVDRSIHGVTSRAAAADEAQGRGWAALRQAPPGEQGP
jgi:hypothetical protein